MSDVGFAQIFSNHIALCLHTVHPRNASIFEEAHAASLAFSERDMSSSGRRNLET